MLPLFRSCLGNHVAEISWKYFPAINKRHPLIGILVIWPLHSFFPVSRGSLNPRCRSGVVDVPPGVAFWNGLCLLQREVWLVKSEIYRNERKLVRMQSGIILVWESEGSTFYYRFYGLIRNEWLDINFLL